MQSEAENPVILNPEEETKVVFVFPGQGSQWIGMGKTLYAQFDVFKRMIDECEKAFSRFVDWSLVAELHKPESENRYGEIDVIQPVLIAMEIALARLWQSFGVQPDAVVGHSMGETAAAYLSGALSLEDAAQIICRRSQLMKKLSGKGMMLLVELTIEQAQEVIKNYTHQVSIAVSNSPQSTVLSGDTEAIEAIKKNLEEKNVFCRLVKVNVASHSPQMDALKPELLNALKGINPQKASVSFYSTVRSEALEGTELSTDYWVDNLREPVMFGKAIQTLLEEQHTVFIEMTPHPILLVQIQQIIEAGEWKAIAVPSLYRDKPEMQEFSQSIAKLYMGGYSFEWSKIYPSAAHIFLPTYPWQKKRYWIEPEDHVVVNSSEKQPVTLQEQTEVVLSFADQIRQLSAKEQEEKVKQVLKEKINTVAGIPIGEIGVDTPFKNMGVDSLMFIQLRNVLKKSIGLEVNVKEFMQNPTLTLSTRFILGKLNTKGNSEQIAVKNTDLSSHTWFDIFEPRPKAAFRVFCFHFAGGSSSLYFPWNKPLHKDIELVAVQMPNRMGDKNYPIYSLEQIAQTLAEAMQDKLDKPYFFFGHSMGGTVLFETCRELRRKGKSLPTQLFVSANPYQNKFDYIDADKLSKDELQHLFPRLGLEGIDDESFHEMLMTILRQDLKALHSYRFIPETPLNISITAIHAQNDALVKLSQMQGWETEAKQGKFNLLIREGDHDYAHEDTAFLVGLLNEALVSQLNKQS